MGLEQRLEIVFESQRDLFGPGIWVQLRIGGHVIEESQRLGAKLLHDTFLGQVAFDKTAIGPNDVG